MAVITGLTTEKNHHRSIKNIPTPPPTPSKKLGINFTQQSRLIIGQISDLSDYFRQQHESVCNQKQKSVLFLSCLQQTRVMKENQCSIVFSILQCPCRSFWSFLGHFLFSCFLWSIPSVRPLLPITPKKSNLKISKIF